MLRYQTNVMYSGELKYDNPYHLKRLNQPITFQNHNSVVQTFPLVVHS